MKQHGDNRNIDRFKFYNIGPITFRVSLKFKQIQKYVELLIKNGEK